MKFLVDTNVALDVILEREPWLQESAAVLSAMDGRAAGYAAGHTITTIHYITAANRGKAAGVAAVSELLRFLEIVPVEKTDLQEALALPLPDYEDAVQAVCARKAGADYIVTRNAKDFKDAPVEPLLPGAALAMLT